MFTRFEILAETGSMLGNATTSKRGFVATIRAAFSQRNLVARGCWSHLKLSRTAGRLAGLNINSNDRVGREAGGCGITLSHRIAWHMATPRREGFERTHLPEKIQFYNVARGSTGELRSLLYVISDNYPRTAPVAERLRSTAISVGKLISGLLRSTEGRKGRLPLALSFLLAPVSYLLASIFR
jgi:hypothetical protein